MAAWTSIFTLTEVSDRASVITSHFENKFPAEIVEELKHSLKDLKTITGFLRIAHSFPLITLDFLSNLEEIHGEMLDRES